MERPQGLNEDIINVVLDRELDERSSDFKPLSAILYSELKGCCSKFAPSTIGEFKRGSGLECMRRLMQRFEPRMTLRKRAHFKAIITCTCAKRVAEMDTNILKLETRTQRAHRRDPDWNTLLVTEGDSIVFGEVLAGETHPQTRTPHTQAHTPAH